MACGREKKWRKRLDADRDRDICRSPDNIDRGEGQHEKDCSSLLMALLDRTGGWSRLNLVLPDTVRKRTAGVAKSFLDEAETVAVRILHIHFTVAPGLVNGGDVNFHPLGDQFRVKSIHVLNKKIGDAARNAIPRERRNMNPNAIAAQAHVAWIRFGILRTVGELQLESK